MSTGPGVSQRAVMEVARGGQPFTADDVVEEMSRDWNVRWHRESIYRAMRNLADAGKLAVTRDANHRILSAQLPVAPKPPKVTVPPKPKRRVHMKQSARAA